MSSLVKEEGEAVVDSLALRDNNSEDEDDDDLVEVPRQSNSQYQATLQ